jgi:MFS family permease
MASPPHDLNGPSAAAPVRPTFQPAANLTNRTFVGLIIAQFLAGFNDQAIHASAMFYAIHSHILTEAGAITLMPILFYAPWAIFCTLAGYYGDRYSKTIALVTWKVAEIVISLVLIVGFLLPGNVGAWIVMSCVFLMGTHAAFFAPAKYGAMPEILQPHVLSRGNGILESTTFLAAILGTVSGGLLSSIFHGQEHWIGVTLLVLSIIGAAASLLIAWLPPANPGRPYPYNLFKPLFDNLKTLMQARPLALSVLGIAFFIFMVSYMRAAVYMHGETRNPRWDEFHTSLIVATVALGVGLGSPLAGYLSGGKVELGMVPLGCVGMMLATFGAALAIEYNPALIAALIVIGFFSGFYMVPLYTLLQHRAPKQSKADMIATSNFINVTGAIAASILFGFLVWLSQRSGVTPAVPVTQVATGKVVAIERAPNHRGQPDPHGKIVAVTVVSSDGQQHLFQAENVKRSLLELQESDDPADVLLRAFEEEEKVPVILDVVGPPPDVGSAAAIAEFEVRGKHTFQVRPAGMPQPAVYDKENLPRYLFLGASLMTLGILVLLCGKLPDFFVRTFFWLRSLRHYQIRAAGMQHLPTRGPVILASNVNTLDASLQLVSATDRSTRVVLLEEGTLTGGNRLLRRMARRTTLIELHAETLTPESLLQARQAALATLADGHLLAISVDTDRHAAEIEALLGELQRSSGAPVLPVYCGQLEPADPTPPLRIRVIFGAALTTIPPLPGLRKAIQELATTAGSTGH